MGNMVQAQNVTPGMKIAFDIMGDTVCVTPDDVKVGDSSCAFWSDNAHRIIVEPWTMVEVLSAPVPEPLTAGSRVLANGRAFLRISNDPKNLMPWIDINNGNHYHWLALRDILGPITILDDNPSWIEQEDANISGDVSSLDEADVNTIYADTDGDLWMQDDSDANNWVCYQLDTHIEFESGFLAPLKPIARKNK
jgi:hypothetical protein